MKLQWKVDCLYELPEVTAARLAVVPIQAKAVLKRPAAHDEISKDAPQPCLKLKASPSIMKKPAKAQKRPAATRPDPEPIAKKTCPPVATPKVEAENDDCMMGLRDKMKARKFDSLWDELPEPLKQEYEKALLVLVS